MDSSGEKDCSVKELLRMMPKIELHAHLNGSLSKKTLLKLSGEENVEELMSLAPSGSLSDCFSIFKFIHSVTQTPSAISTVTEDVITDFHADNVKYLELRSTPREVPNVMSFSSYVDVMLSTIHRMEFALPDISVKLLLSIDRSKPVQAAEETLKIAESHLCSTDSTIVGIDLSGNPSVGNIDDFMPILQRAKQIGLKLSLHMAEVPNTDPEVKKLLSLQPDRIGHGTYIHPSKGGCKTNFETLQEKKIPLELCLTSNVLSGTISSYEDHHLPLWRNIGHPCIICTDDKGVFNTSLTNEYYLAKNHYSLPIKELWKMSFESIEYCFADDTLKQKLRDTWKKTRDRFNIG